MSTDSAHNSWWQIFEVIFGLFFVVGIALQLVVPLSLPGGFLTPVYILVGAVLVVIGAALVVLARQEFARHRQPTGPGHPTSQLVTTGVFSLSRNPLYLGGVSVLAGIALVFNLPWVLVLLLLALVACHYILIAPEEKYLASKFGDAYADYAASVHRWLGRA